MPASVAAGVYRHYKAQRHYLVLGLGHDANAAGRTVVVYVPLYVEPAQTGPRLAVRTLADFLSWVDPWTGATVEAGTPGATRRFTFVPDTTGPDPTGSDPTGPDPTGPATTGPATTGPAPTTGDS